MRFEWLKLYTPEPRELLEFYTQTLGLPLVVEQPQGFSVQAGRTRLSFAQAAVGQKPVYHFAFNIPHNQLTQATKWAKGRFSLIADSSGQTRFFRSTGRLIWCISMTRRATF